MTIFRALFKETIKGYFFLPKSQFVSVWESWRFTLILQRRWRSLVIEWSPAAAFWFVAYTHMDFSSTFSFIQICVFFFYTTSTNSDGGKMDPTTWVAVRVLDKGSNLIGCERLSGPVTNRPKQCIRFVAT